MRAIWSQNLAAAPRHVRRQRISARLASRIAALTMRRSAPIRSRVNSIHVLSADRTAWPKKRAAGRQSSWRRRDEKAVHVAHALALS